MAKLCMVILLALVAAQAAMGRKVPSDASFKEEKNFVAYGGVSTIAGVPGYPFPTGIVGGLGGAGNIGGLSGAGRVTGFGGLGGVGGGAGAGVGTGVGGGAGAGVGTGVGGGALPFP